MTEKIRPRTPREEFQKFRRKLLRENGIEHLICARCGEWRISVHLHHITELVHGGTNDTENLIPLCYECHHEWDVWDDGEFDFGTFLLTPKLRDIRKIYFGKLAISTHSMLMCHVTQNCIRSTEWANMYCDGEDDYEYIEEYRRQNDLFSKYPYSDTKRMFELFGNVNPPLVLEDLTQVRVDDALLDSLHTRTKWVGERGV